jgi:hypothetical protein
MREELLQRAVYDPAGEARLLDHLVHPSAALYDDGPSDGRDLLVELSAARPDLPDLVEGA